MKINLRLVLAAMLCAVVLYAGFALWRGLGVMGATLAAFSWSAFAVACFLAFCNYVLRYIKWEYYLLLLDIRGVGKFDSFLIFLSGFVLTVTPGKVGEVFKSFVLQSLHHVAVAKSAPIVVAERVTDLIGVIVLIVVGSLGFSGGLKWAGVGAALVFVILLTVSSRRLSHLFIRLIQRLPGPARSSGPKLLQAYEGLSVLVRPRSLVFPTLLSIAGWSLEGAGLWAILRGFNQSTRAALCEFFYATSTLVGALGPIPGGVGITEALLQEQLVGLGQVPPTISTAAMILTRFATLWFAVLVGFTALAWLKKRHPNLLREL